MFLISPRYKDSCLISSFVQSWRYLAWFFQKTQNYYWNWWNRGKMGDTDNSDFGSASFGKNCICHVIPDAIRVPKMYILFMLEISRVITIPIILWGSIHQEPEIQIYYVKSTRIGDWNFPSLFESCFGFSNRARGQCNISKKRENSDSSILAGLTI